MFLYDKNISLHDKFHLYDCILPVTSMNPGPEPNSFIISGSGTFSGYDKNTAAQKLYIQGFSKIAVNSFANYPSLTSIVFDDNVKEFENNINRGLSSLTVLLIPKSAEIFSSFNSFDGDECIAKVLIHPENKNYMDIDGIVYTKDMKKLYFWPSQHGESVIHVPYGVVTIGCGAFINSNKFRKIYFPSTVKTVESWQFVSVVNLEYVELRNQPQNVKIDPEYFLYNVPKGISVIHYKSTPISFDFIFFDQFLFKLFYIVNIISD